MARATPVKKPPAPAPKASSTAPGSLSEAVHTVDNAKTNAEVFDGIVAIYEKFLTQKDPKAVVDALSTLHSARFLETHAWRVREHALAPSAQQQQQHHHAWRMTVILLVSHGLRTAKTASDTTASWAFLDPDVDAWRVFLASLLDDFAHNHQTSSRCCWTLRDKASLVQFLIQCFGHLEIEPVARELLKIVSLPMWSEALSSSQRAIEFADHPKLARHWKNLMGDANKNGNDDDDEPAKKKRRKATGQASPSLSVTQRETHFMVALLQDVVALVTTKTTKTKSEQSEEDALLQYVALTLALLIDLLSALPTRKFLPVVLRRLHFLPTLHNSVFLQDALETRNVVESAALQAQLTRVEHLLWVSIDTHSGRSLTTVQDKKEAETRKIQLLQEASFQPKYRDTPLEALAIVPVATLLDPKSCQDLLLPIAREASSRQSLNELSVLLGVVGDVDKAQALTAEQLVEYFVDEYANHTPSSSQHEEIAGQRLPTELEIWNDALVGDHNSSSSTIYGTGPSVLFPLLALPKLGLQYLNLTDFLDRNGSLFRLQAANAIRNDLENCIAPLNAVRSLLRHGETVFRGFAQRAAPLLTAFSITEIAKPEIGATHPSQVLATFEIELDTRHDIKAIDKYEPKEVVYLVTIRPTRDEAAEAMGFVEATSNGEGIHFAEEYGVLYVRCAELVSVQDEHNKYIRDQEQQQQQQQEGKEGCDFKTSGANSNRGRKRTLCVSLDGAQYKKDQESGQLGAYEYVNLLVRRDPKTTNFKALLDIIAMTWKSKTRDLPNAKNALPSWLYDLFLGYGDPSSASFEAIAKRKMQATLTVALHEGLFVDAARAVECCSSDHSIVDPTGKPLAVEDACGPYKLVVDVATKKRTLEASAKPKDHAHKPTTTTSSPRLTKEQAQVVIHGSAEGLTLVDTHGASRDLTSDTIAHLVQNLYQNGVDKNKQKILVVARSTESVDLLVSKLSAMPFVDEASLVRLSSATDKGASPYSVQGRIDFLLQRRLELLNEVDATAQWMEKTDPVKFTGLGSGSVSYSCENALFFYRFYLRDLCLQAQRAAHSGSAKDAGLLASYYADRMGSTDSTGSRGSEPVTQTELLDFVARIEAIYEELERLQAFELLQTPTQRRDVYVMQHARVVVVTCRELALQFATLAKLGLHWASVVVDEACQLRELDTLVPLLLASSSSKGFSSATSLKRLILVGDGQESVVDGDGDGVRTTVLAALEAYAKLDRSLFSRWARLGVPLVPLLQEQQQQPVHNGKAIESASRSTTTTTGPTKATPQKKPTKRPRNK